MQFENLYTTRLQLRKISFAVLDHVFKNYPENELMHFLGAASLHDLEKERDRHNKGLITFNKSFLYFQLILKGTGVVIGWCGFHTWYLDHNRAELGYGLLSNDYKKQGLMSEAIIPIIGYGFNQMNLHRIEAFVEPENIPSLKIMEKMNFVKEGLLREHYLKDNAMEDSAVYSLLRHEYFKG